MTRHSTNKWQVSTSLFYLIRLVTIVITLCFVGACTSNKITDTDTEEIDVGDWTEVTHGNSGNPDYEEVFSEGIVRRLDIVIDSPDWQAMQDDMTTNYGEFGSGSSMAPGVSMTDPIWVSCALFYKDIQWYKVGIRFKGNSSLRTTWQMGIGKLSLKLDFDEFEDQYPTIVNQRFYGFKQLNLGNGYDDKSLLRERATAEIFRDAGLVAAHTAFYRVYVDVGNGPVYFGLYTMIEEVDDTVVDDQFNNDDGNLYKPEGRGATFVYGSFSSLDFTKKSNESGSDWSDIEELFDVLHSNNRVTNPVLWRSSLESVLNVDGFLRWLAVNTVIQNWDTYGISPHNYFLYNNPGDSLLTWIPWDNNEALQEGKQGGALSLALNEVSDGWPLISFLIDDTEYRATYNHYVRYTIDSVFVSSTMSFRYQAWHDLIAPYVTGADGEIDGYSFLSSTGDFDSELSYLINHVSERQAAVAAYLGEVQ